ncbi:MAG: DNA repair exonuclease [Lautropia sp.]|nr:DNA repair exonuclease [Lautropia sp.]
MKFIHTADLHLDSPLRALSAYPDAPAERLRDATRAAFSRLVDIAIDESVDFMVIAGDIYDGDWKDFNTGLFFVRQMGQLRRAGIPVYLLYGNHDAESDMTRTLTLPDNVHVFPSRKATTFELPALKVALHGRSFRVAETTENLVPGYPDPVPGWLNIGVLHTALEGNAEHARYAPCSVSELQAKGYQYWALGHVHESWIQRGETCIAFPGNIQGRHIREQGARGALLVSAEGNEITDISRLDVDVLRWQQQNVLLAPDDDMAAAIRKAGQALEQLLKDTPAQLPLAVRVIFSGITRAHEALVARDEQLRQEVIAQAVALDADRIWIEKVKLATQALPAPLQTADAHLSDALAELASIIATAPGDEEFTQSLMADWQALLEKLPADVREVSPELQTLRQDPHAQLADRLQQAQPLLMDRIAQLQISSSI